MRCEKMEYTLDNSKQELIAEIDRRVDDKIIEKSNSVFLQACVFQSFVD